MRDEMSQPQFAHSTLSNEIVYHAVYIPQENNETYSKSDTIGLDNVHVYLDKNEALKVIKENKTGRLKTFKNRSDAEEYARTGYENTNFCSTNCVKTSTLVSEEKSNNFKAPKSQELVCFRKLIEGGDLETVRNTIWGNPRYLISSGDTPAILQEGCRYNALHIAVKANKPDMCELILNTVGNTEFIQLLYGEEERKSYLDRAQIMLDLYLNTPDKGLNETPLHFAVKFGLKDVVQVLVSYSQCIKTLPNKYKQTPMDIICSRKCQEDEQLKKEIHALLEDQYYVPVLRSEDNTLQPIIGELFSPTNPLNLNNDPISPRIEIRAFAGPMTKSRAVEFRRKWKTPPRGITPIKKNTNNETNVINNSMAKLALKFQDTEKGLEKVGRDLAEEYQVPWKEYWPFLNDFADFRCANGLGKLEKYLERRFKEQLYNRKDVTNSNCNADLRSNKLELNEIDNLCNALQSCAISVTYDQEDNNIDDAEFFTPPSSPELIHNDSDDEMFTAEEGPVTFIEGPLPTKLDDEVYNAVPSTINDFTYPNIYRWQNEMKLIMRRNTNRSCNTNAVRKKLFHDFLTI